MSLFIRRILIVGILFVGCSEDFSDNPQPNQPPETHISILSDNQLNGTTSRQTFNWWGDDPDGFVTGFIYTFDENAENVETWDNESPQPFWTFTTERGQTFTLRLAGEDTVYTLRVKAIDDDGAADPSSAEKQFPIINSKPFVEFPVGTDVPETTFTIASILWSGSDPDGDNNIAKFQYVLDDTTKTWIEIEPNINSVTLTAADGLTEGEHIFYLRAFDIAGAKSNTIRMPRDDSNVWYVRVPKSNFLVIDDHDILDNTAAFYQAILKPLVNTFDVWDIKRDGGALEPPSSKAFTETLLLFDRIFWFSDPNPTLEKAQVSIPQFLENGGKVIMSLSFSTTTSNVGDPLAFAPVDSLGDRISRITRNQLFTRSAFAEQLGLPELKQNTAIIPNVFPLAPKISANPLYALAAKPGSWSGEPVIGLIDANNTFVFFGLPLAGLDGFGSVSELIGKIILEIF